MSEVFLVDGSFQKVKVKNRKKVFSEASLYCTSNFGLPLITGGGAGVE